VDGDRDAGLAGAREYEGVGVAEDARGADVTAREGVPDGGR
jgi:hypothetical protein